MGAQSGGRIQTAVTFAALVFLFAPLIVVVLFSFHSSGSLSFPFEGFSLRWYRSTFGSPQFTSALQNSLIVAAVTAVTTFVLGTLAAYGVSRASPRLRGPLALVFFLPITLPGVFLGVALLIYYVRLDLQFSLTTIMISHMVYVSPYFFIVARTAMDRLDPALEEVALDLGAKPAEVFLRVTMPQLWPILLGATALAFMLSFDEFVITFFVSGGDTTLPVFIFGQMRRTVDPTINVVSSLLIGGSLALWITAFVYAAVLQRRAKTRKEPSTATAAAAAPAVKDAGAPAESEVAP